MARSGAPSDAPVRDRGPAAGSLRGGRLEALARCRLLAGASAEELEAVLDGGRLWEVPAGETLAREGEGGRELFFVLAGEVRLWRADLALSPQGPGGHFGALSLLSGRPRAVTAVAGSAATLLVLERAAWEALCEARPKLAVRLLEAVVAHLRSELVERTDSLTQLLRGRSQPRAREVVARLGGEERRVATGTPLRALLPAEVDGRLVVAALLGQKPVALATPLTADASVAPLTAGHGEGQQILLRSAGLLLLEAAAALPGLGLRLGEAVGEGRLAELPPGADGASIAARLGPELERLVARDLPFRHELWGTDEAIAWFREQGWDDAALLLRGRREGTVSLVSCGGLYALGQGPMLPSTGLLRGLRLLPRDGGLLLLPAGPPAPQEPPHPLRDGEMGRAHRAWLEAMGLRSVGAFNDLCVSGQVSQVIRVAEGFQEKRIGRIADEIAAGRGRLRIIAIAGPSSSGKTTFIKRLKVQLQVAGLNPVGFSLDDYYLDRVRTPRDARGDYDFEALEALDLPLLQDHVARQIRGEAVRTARYDFKTGRSQAEGGPLLQLGEGDVLMMEGIHGLNPALLGTIPQPGQLFRVFVHPATTLAFDRLDRVSAADVRLLRRIIRDRHQRGYSAAENITRWPAVLEGERRHIFPFRAEADAVFDTTLVYELAVLKVFAERYLLEVAADHPAYGTALRLRTLIDRFVAIYPDHVPQTSLLREFIGGSGFEA